MIATPESWLFHGARPYAPVSLVSTIQAPNGLLETLFQACRTTRKSVTTLWGLSRVGSLMRRRLHKPLSPVSPISRPTKNSARVSPNAPTASTIPAIPTFVRGLFAWANYPLTTQPTTSGTSWVTSPNSAEEWPQSQKPTKPLPPH